MNSSKKISRRTVLGWTTMGGTAALAAGRIVLGRRTPPTRVTDIRLENVSIEFEEFAFRAPFKFAGAVVDRQTMLTARVEVRSESGQKARGFGVAPLNYTFAFPSARLAPAERLAAMKALAESLAKTTASARAVGHPLEIYHELAPAFEETSSAVSRRLELPEPIPKLALLVVSGAFDAAIHDAYGKLHGVSSFATLGSRYMNRDLSSYLGAEFRGEYPEKYIATEPRPRAPLCHTVSGVDPLDASDNPRPLKDGLPETLREWIDYNGLTYFKIKLGGVDPQADLERTLDIDRVVTEAQRKRNIQDWRYLLDPNEKCPSAAEFEGYLRKLAEKAPDGFRRIEYAEQPTNRELAAHPENDMRKVAALCPVVIDESMIDLESVSLAQKLGWTGVVVKSPKGLSNMILIAALAAKRGMRIAGGDMSCPGASLIQTASFQARLPGVTSIEANARQLMPAANKPWENRFPGIFHVKDGWLDTSELIQPGLGAPN